MIPSHWASGEADNMMLCWCVRVHRLKRLHSIEHNKHMRRTLSHQLLRVCCFTLRDGFTSLYSWNRGTFPVSIWYTTWATGSLCENIHLHIILHFIMKRYYWNDCAWLWPFSIAYKHSISMIICYFYHSKWLKEIKEIKISSNWNEF